MVADEPASRIAFQVWLGFMKHVSPNTKKSRSVEDFIRSPDYLSFVKFANYLIELKPTDSDNFIKWLFKMNVRIADWCKNGTYAIYIQELCKKETVERAVERSLITIQEWSNESKVSWDKFFDLVPTATATTMIVNGRITPWLLYALPAAQSLLERMEPGQLDAIARSIDIEWWKKTIVKNQQEVQWVKTLISAETK